MRSEHAGHRKRLLSKLPSGTLEMHELLEILFFYSIKQKNTNGLAHRALADFGDAVDLFSANLEQLQQINGIGLSTASLIMCVEQIHEKLNQATKRSYPKKYDVDGFLKYAETEYRGLQQEVFDVYLLKADRSIWMRKRFTSDSVSSVTVDTADFSNLVAVNRPAGLVIAHNHPSGSADPSEKDDKTTKDCQMICRMHNVLFCEHAICSPTGTFSYYKSGKLLKIIEQTKEQS